MRPASTLWSRHANASLHLKAKGSIGFVRGLKALSPKDQALWTTPNPLSRISQNTPATCSHGRGAQRGALYRSPVSKATGENPLCTLRAIGILINFLSSPTVSARFWDRFWKVASLSESAAHGPNNSQKSRPNNSESHTFMCGHPSSRIEQHKGR